MSIQPLRKYNLPAHKWPPRTHDGDPPTSHEAEARARKFIGGHTAAVLWVVTESPGLNRTEIAERVSDDPTFSDETYRRITQVAKRLSDLHKVHHLIHPRVVSGEREARWFLNQEAT